MSDTSNIEHRTSNIPRIACPKCEAEYLGWVVTGPVDFRYGDDGAMEYFRLRQFPCHHCAIIVTWRQVCAPPPDGTLTDDRMDRRDTGYLKGLYYHRWLAKHPLHAALEQEAA